MEQNLDTMLNADQIAFFHREGFLALDSIVSHDEIEKLRIIYDRLFEERAGRETGDQFDLAGTDEDGKAEALPQILSPSKYAPELLESSLYTNALLVARQLLGDDAMSQGEHAILKPARYGAPTPWHQDEAYWNPSMQYNAISIWVPLQDATLENGCMHFIPGSHHLEVQPHHSIGNDPRIHGLEIDEVDATTAVACPIPAGGATIHGPRMLHYAGPNRSDIPRRAYILMYGLPPAQRSTPRRFPWMEAKQTARMTRAEKEA